MLLYKTLWPHWHQFFLLWFPWPRQLHLHSSKYFRIANVWSEGKGYMAVQTVEYPPRPMSERSVINSMKSINLILKFRKVSSKYPDDFKPISRTLRASFFKRSDFKQNDCVGSKYLIIICVMINTWKWNPSHCRVFAKRHKCMMYENAKSPYFPRFVSLQELSLTSALAPKFTSKWIFPT